MPKMKSHRGAAKRFRVTKNGKVKHKSSRWRQPRRRVRAKPHKISI